VDLTSAPPRGTASASPAAENPVAMAVGAALDVAHGHNPYGAYAVLRDTLGFPLGSLGTHVIARYRDCARVLQDPAWSHAEQSHRDGPAPSGGGVVSPGRRRGGVDPSIGVMGAMRTDDEGEDC